MSGCKHEFETVNVSYLLSTLKAITDRTKELTYEEKDAVITVCRHCERLKSDVERDALQAQVAVLRGALETATDYLYNPFEPDNQCAQYKNIKNILQTTPAEAAERVQKLVEALEAWEKWEAEIIMDDGCWEPGGMAVLPTMTKAIYEKMIELQQVRNEALSEWRRDKCS